MVPCFGQAWAGRRWSFASGRYLAGAAVDQRMTEINSDFRQFELSGPAPDLIASACFVTGEGQLSTFTSEPPTAPFNYSIIPGHLRQVWLGAGPDRFFTVTSA